MNEFVQFVLSKLQGSIVLILLVIPLLAVCILAAFLICKKKQIKFSWKKVILWTLLAGYLVALIYITLLRGGSAEFRSMNLHLFRAWREAWNNFSVRNWLNVLLNVAMFVPMGVLLPLVFPKLRTWYKSIGIGLGLSLVIELLQLWRGSGVCDVDDLFANTLGTVIGYAAVIILVSFNPKIKICWKKILCCGLALLISLGSIGGIFITYQLKEYGNIPHMASFRADTKDTIWALTCSLPEVQQTMTTYRAMTMTKEECASFAEAFSQKFGIVYDTIQYYDEEAYFMDHGGDDGSHFLIISYLDGGYDYRGNTWNVDSWMDTDRETILAALKEYPLTIPKQATFSSDGDGWHSFTADCLIIGDTMYDGTIRCRYGSDGIIYEVENHLISYQPYDQTTVISAKKAFDRLCAGHFSGGEYFEYRSPKNVNVVGIDLEYKIDTKGFYRPVYVFDMEAADATYRATVAVRAD